jgi:hypothetical protein
MLLCVLRLITRNVPKWRAFTTVRGNDGCRNSTDPMIRFGGGSGGFVDEEVLDVPPGQRLGEVLGDAAAVAATVVAGGGRRRGRRVAGAAAEAAAGVRVVRRRRRPRGRLGGEPHAGEQEPGVAHGEVARRVHRHVAVAAQDRPVLLAEQEAALLLHRSIKHRNISSTQNQNPEQSSDRRNRRKLSERTWQMSQSGEGCWCAEPDGELSSDSLRCLPASLLALCTRRSHASQSAASSAQQNSEAASAAHTSHCTFIFLPSSVSAAHTVASGDRCLSRPGNGSSGQTMRRDGSAGK